MPELPEVETIRLTLTPGVVGRTITGVTLDLPKMLQNLSPEDFNAAVMNQRVAAIDRRGKYLLFRLSGETTLAFHLRMTGQLTVETANQPATKATYLKLTLDDGRELRFRDQRKFGKVFLFPTGKIPAALGKLGPEPLTPEFTLTVFQRCLSGRKLAIKKALLNQEIIAGIGNIYADEALFVAGILPLRSLESLNEGEVAKLYEAIRKVLREGIKFRGTTKRDYRDGAGNPGSYQDHLRVYGRKGLPCPVCRTPIVRISLGGRGAHFCPICQR